MSKYGILIHGGAGEEPTDSQTADIMDKIIESSFSRLANDSAINVAEYAVMQMEDSGFFNAGTGSCLAEDKTIEMDAGIMDGTTMQCGGAGAVSDIKNPVSLARAIMENSSHSLIVGEGASKFAQDRGIPKIKVTPTTRTLKKFEETGSKYGTVGAVVRDRNGNLAAAVSTGGIWKKSRGRVGDSAIAGSGYFAKNDTGAVVATGNGDAIIKSSLATRACMLMESMSAQEAVERAVSELAAFDEGLGGLIAVSGTGERGISHNTASMSVAHRLENI